VHKAVAKLQRICGSCLNVGPHYPVSLVQVRSGRFAQDRARLYSHDPPDFPPGRVPWETLVCRI